jgi:hypothetical protein
MKRAKIQAFRNHEEEHRVVLLIEIGPGEALSD